MTGDGRPLDDPAGWDAIAPLYDATRSFPGAGEVEVPRRLSSVLRTLGVAALLEPGVGTGRLAVPLARSGLRVVGIDRSPGMVARLREKAAGAPVEVVLADAARPPFFRVFDAALFAHFLHLVPDLEALAAGLAPVFLPGAYVLSLDGEMLPEPAEERAWTAVYRRLGDPYAPRPRGEDTRERRLFAALLRALGARPLPALSLGVYPREGTIRRHLEEVRRRLWARFWECDEARMAAAVDSAERDLLAEGADLDAPVPEPLGVDLLLGRMPG